jgi:hypothetical protein
MKNKGALVGSHLTFELTPAGGPPITGTVTEIEKIPNSTHFIYTVQSSQSLTSSLTGSLLVLTYPDTTYRGDTLGPVISVDPLNNTLTCAKFRKFVKLRDDDRTAVDSLLPYDFLNNDFAFMQSKLDIFKEAYLEPKPVYSDTMFNFKSHIWTTKSFGQWVYYPSKFKRVEQIATGGDPIGVWLCLVCAVWQSGAFKEKDNDPDSQFEATNYGATLPEDPTGFLVSGINNPNDFVLAGGNVTVIPFEQMMDRGNSLNGGDKSIVHEIGHQFGLQHPIPPEPSNMMNESLNPLNSPTTFSISKLHLNYIRCRKTSPGIEP